MRAEDRLWKLAAPLLVAALFAFQAWVRFQSDIIHDTAWFIHVARGLLAGKQLYVDFIEVNPPLALWLMVPPVALADTLGANPAHAIYMLLLVLTLATLLLASRYLRIAQTLEQGKRAALLVLLAAILLFLPRANFAEREQFMVLLVLPWIMLRGLRLQGLPVPRAERAIIGILAALAIALKPQAALAPLCMEAYALWRGRPMRQVFAIENIAATLCGLAYVAAVWLWVPAYLTTMVPLGAAAYYPYFKYPFGVLLFNGRWAIIFLVLALALRRGLPQGASLLFGGLCAAAVGFVGAYAIQQRGFSYQVLPAEVCAAAALALVAVAAELQQRVKRAAAAVLVLALLATEGQAYVADDALFTRARACLAPSAQSVFIASTKLSHPFPFVLKQGLVWASRMPTQWTAPYIAQTPGGTATPIGQQTLQWTMDDLETLKPDLVLVETDKDAPYLPPGGFDYLAFWEQSPRFAGIWKDYASRGMVGSFAVYSRAGMEKPRPDGSGVQSVTQVLGGC